MTILSLLSLSVFAASADLGPGDHERLLQFGDLHRSYTMHVPASYDAKRPVPVVLALHGAGTNGRMMAKFSGLNAKADSAGFVVVYPNGTGAGGLMLTWNAGSLRRKGGNSTADDVAYLRAVLDDLERCLNVDKKRVYATGMSNGGMMCYRLAAEMSDRIAAIAPVAGTMAVDDYHPRRPVPVILFHGTDDRVVPLDGPKNEAAKAFGFKSVPETIRSLVDRNGCAKEPRTADLPDTARDGTKVSRKIYAAKENEADVVVYIVEGGGHTWPGHEPPVRFIGKSTKQISANDLIWEFFQKHAMEEKRKEKKLKN